MVSAMNDVLLLGAILVSATFSWLSMACAPASQPTAAPLPEPREKVAPTWEHALTGVSVQADSEEWVLTPSASSGLDAALRLDADAGCQGHVSVAEAEPSRGRDRATRLQDRLAQRLRAEGVHALQIRDQGEVPLGRYRGWMMRVSGQRAGQPWYARIAATFLSHETRRVYVEVLATSDASGFVSRRACYDRLLRAVTFPEEVR